MDEIVIGGKFKILRKLSEGGFCKVYVAQNKFTMEHVAVKMELAKSKHPQLQYEAKLYKILQGGVGIPNIHSFLQEGDYNILVTDLMGPTLEELFEYCQHKFTMKTVLMLMDQFLQRIEFLHSRHFIHRDIKPDNFVVGTGKKMHYIFLIDYGLTKRFRDPKTSEHIPYKDGKNFTGSARYASSLTHLGIEQSRRDDLESLGYMMIYFLKGSLPWQGQKTQNNEERLLKIKKQKMSIGVQQLCEGLPEEFSVYMNYVRNLRFEEKPDMAHLRKLFKDYATSQGIDYDFVFDWMVRKIPSPRASQEEAKDNTMHDK